MHKFKAIVFILLFYSAGSFAKPVLTITPSSASGISLPQTGQATVDYTVTNSTNSQYFQQLTIYPANGLSDRAASAISVTGNTCTGTLNPGATCTFQITLTGNINLPQQFVLSPKVCVSIGALCSVPLENQRIIVTKTNAPPPVQSGCTAPGNPGCYVMVSVNQVQGDMTVQNPAPPGAPDVSACNGLVSFAKADCICDIEGRAANSGNGIWRAWLGGNTDSPRGRLGASAFPATSSWVSLETGNVVYSNWGTFSDSTNTYPDATNAISTSSTRPFTGGNDPPISAFTCTDWVSATPGGNCTFLNQCGDVGDPMSLVAQNGVSSWNSLAGGAVDRACDAFRPLYCTEVDQ